MGSRNDEGALLEATYGNGVRTVRSYEPASGRLATLQQLHGGVLWALTYKYYDDGRVRLRDEAAGGGRLEGYGYDALHRLTS